MNDDKLNVNELTRQGKNVCEKCFKPKIMYYKQWCPYCEKPEIVSTPVLNFIQALTYLEVSGVKGIKQRLSDYCFDAYEYRNDSIFELFFPTQQEIDGGEYSEDQIEDLKIIKETFNLSDSVLMKVSW